MTGLERLRTTKSDEVEIVKGRICAALATDLDIDEVLGDEELTELLCNQEIEELCGIFRR